MDPNTFVKHFTAAFMASWIFCLQVQSQTLTAADLNPQPGDIFKTSMAYYMPPNTNGQGIVWNYGNIPSMQTPGIDTIFAASAVPSASSYPSANVVRKSGNNFIYLKATGTGIEQVGTAVTYPILPCPLYYGSYTLHQYSTTTVSGTNTNTTKTTIAFSTTGSGTITTPAGTFKDVLKVEVNEYMELYQNNVLQFWLLTKSNQWYMSGFHDPIFTAVMKTTSQPNVDYFPYVLVSREVPDFTDLSEEPLLSEVKMHPNPASSHLEISGSHLASFKILIIDALGRNILVKNVVGEREKIDVSGLEPGIYLMTLKAGASVHTKKIIISR